MLSMGVGIECQATLSASTVVRPKLPHLLNNNTSTFKPRRTTSPSSSFFISHSLPHLKLRTDFKLSAAAEALVAQETAADDVSPADDGTEKLGVVVKPMEKPRLVLKFIWMEKNIGIALDQMIPGHGSIPLSPYYFWPRKDAWEELKVLLESKPWISQKQMIILLNQATDIINLWQQSGGNLA
ncbi:PREDICTED: 30S ribosomal protein 3, chloroplastic-like [Fragaria vesca subsp. vesca]|uniref:30S ribosomal protein 3, chloroplastic-like n=1 Tax=Fragaria vesca subsp. vesca TaxID=101020 RepID=UPI0002C310D7|nr:PREDICTED: 30S ribosomal protein 3, chloroplastic-like [Fragaria vesca subsp. vesca]